MKKISLIVIGLMFFLGLTGSILMGMAPGLIKIGVGLLSLSLAILGPFIVGYLFVCGVKLKFLDVEPKEVFALTVLGYFLLLVIGVIGVISYAFGEFVIYFLGFKL